MADHSEHKNRMDARPTPYSSVVGGGLILFDQSGRAAFQLSIIGTSNGVTREENDAIARRLAELINSHGLEVPRR